MKNYVAVLLLLFLPSTTFAAVALGHTSASNDDTGSATTISWSHTSTGDNELIVSAAMRGDVTNMSCTYNSVSMTKIAGPLTCTAGAYNQQWVFKLANPSTGSNTVSCSWTTGARVAIVGTSYSGVVSVGTPTQATGALSYSQTITANDMVVGVWSVADDIAMFSMTPTYDVGAHSTNYVGIEVNHNTGTGSVSVTGTYGSGYQYAVGAGLVLTGASSGGGVVGPGYFWLFDW